MEGTNEERVEGRGEGRVDGRREVSVKVRTEVQQRTGRRDGGNKEPGKMEWKDKRIEE